MTASTFINIARNINIFFNIRPWVQFNDSPRIAVDGLYLRSFIRSEVDVDDSMGFAIARLLNKGLGSKDSESGTTCQFLLHDWAVRY
jgi:hypothetical protein